MELLNRLLLVAFVIPLHSVTSQRWRHGNSGCGSTALKASSSVTTLTSPGYPDNYPSDLHCTWRIESNSGEHIVIKIDYVFIEDSDDCRYDSLSIYKSSDERPENKIVRLCGREISRTIPTGSSRVTVVFHSDGSTEERGFKLQFHAGTEEGCNVVTSLSSGVITSPRYPSLYPDNSDCTTLIRLPLGKRVDLSFTDLTLEFDDDCKSDYVDIFDGPSKDSKSLGRFCGNWGGVTLQSSTNLLLVNFHSDKLVNAQGFKIEYSSKGISEDRESTKLCPWKKSDSGGTLSSPNFPDTHAADSDCTFELTGPSDSTITLTLENLGLNQDCSNSFLEIHDGRNRGSTVLKKICGHINELPSRTIVSSKNYMFVIFKSGPLKNGAGFEASYTINTNTFCGQPKIQPDISKPDVDNHNRIIGGRDATRGAYPWQIVIYHKEEDLYFCGGSLLSEKWVLTAAHCYSEYNFKLEDTEVLIGKNNVNLIEKGETISDVKRLIIHEFYKKDKYDNDIALIELATRVVFSEFISPVCLGDSADVSNLIEEETFPPGIVTGWGVLQENGSQPSVLQDLSLPIQPRVKCQRSTQSPVTENMFCAGYDQEIVGAQVKKDSCQGDSGGPFVVKRYGRWTLAGVVSWGDGCARKGKYGFYTKVDRYHDWIKSKM